MARERAATRSQFPDPMVPEEFVYTTVGASISPDASAVSRVVQANRLLGLYPTTPGGADAVFLAGMLSDDDARKLGVTCNPQRLFDDLTDAMITFAPAVRASRLTGFGPVRARFLVERMHALAASLDAHDSLGVGVRLASLHAERSMEFTGPVRRKAALAIESLLAGVPELRDRVRESAPSTEKADAHIRSLEGLAEVARVVRQHVPTTLLADAGLTVAVLDALESAARTASAARSRHRKERESKQTLRAELAAPVGRLVFEFRQLLTSAKQARRSDPTIPTHTSSVLQRASRRSPAVPAPTPAPDPQ